MENMFYCITSEERYQPLKLGILTLDLFREPQANLVFIPPFKNATILLAREWLHFLGGSGFHLKLIQTIVLHQTFSNTGLKETLRVAMWKMGLWKNVGWNQNAILS